MKDQQTVPTIDEIRQKALPVLKRHHARRAGLFGSIVRGELHADSDILVELGDDFGLIDVVGKSRELEEALGRKVDLVEYESTKSLIKERILAEQIPLL